jgi:hypothetical protein
MLIHRAIATGTKTELPILSQPDMQYIMEWIDLAQDVDQWRALVNTVMKLRVP